MYEISKQRLLQIAKDSPKSKIKIKQWYPDVFDFKKGWYVMNSGQDIYQLYLNDSDQTICYGTMGGSWANSYGFLPDWIQNRIDDSEVLDMLIKSGIEYGVIPSDANTALWTYNEEDESVKNGDGLFVYRRGAWTTSISIENTNLNEVLTNTFEGEGWYKCNWGYATGFVYIKNNRDDVSYGFYAGEWRRSVWYSQTTSMVKCFDGEMRDLMTEEAIKRGYTRDNIISLDGVDNAYFDNIREWSFYSDILYTERLGNGGMVAYRNGIWDNKR